MLEQELILRAQKGDSEAFDTLVRETLPSTYRFLRSLGASVEDAEDAVQDTYVRVWRSLGRFDAGRSFRPWLFQIAKNSFIDLARKRHSVAFADMGEEGADGALLIPDAAPLPDALFEKEESRVRVRTALATLAPQEQAILSLRYDEGFSFEDIAEALQKPPGTIRSIHHRALAKLRSILKL